MFHGDLNRGMQSPEAASPLLAGPRIAPSSRPPALCNTNFHLHRRDKDPTNRKSTHKGDSQRCAGTNNLRLNCQCQALAHRRPTRPFQQPAPSSLNVYTFTRPKDSRSHSDLFQATPSCTAFSHRMPGSVIPLLTHNGPCGSLRY